MKKRYAMILMLTALAACGDGTNPNVAVGELASDRIELTAETNEPIVAILVAEGDRVTAGQVLVEQDARRATARLAEAEAALAQLQARFDELVRGPRAELIKAARANVEGATQDLEFRQSELQRTRDVHARGLASPEALDRAQAALDRAGHVFVLGIADDQRYQPEFIQQRLQERQLDLQRVFLGERGVELLHPGQLFEGIDRGPVDRGVAT